MRCLHGSLAECEIGTSSSPQVRHATFFSGGADLGEKNAPKTDGAFFSLRAPTEDFARLTSVFAAADVELRLSDGRRAPGSILTVDDLLGVAGGVVTIALTGISVKV